MVAAHLDELQHDAHAVDHLLHLRQLNVDAEEDAVGGRRRCPAAPAAGRPCVMLRTQLL